MAVIIKRVRRWWQRRQRELRLCQCWTEDLGGPYDMPRTHREECPVHGPARTPHLAEVREDNP